MYDSTAIVDLRDRTEYELWLLEAVHEIVGQRLAVEGMDELIYPPNGGPPGQTIYGIGRTNIGDWRPGFLKAGAPLVFVTAFKLLDMLLEWVLQENGQSSTHSFVQKIVALRKSVQFPQVIETRSWLRDRLVGLYEGLEPLRGTVIHSRHFTTSDGGLDVSSSKHGVVGPRITVSAADLRNIALTVVSLLRYIEGSWSMDLFRERRIRRALDEVSHLHGQPLLGQLPPGFLTVRVYVLAEGPIQWNIKTIRQDVAAKRPGQDVIFDLRIVAVSRDGTGLSAYLIPWDQIENSIASKTLSDLGKFAVAPPAELDVQSIAHDLQVRDD